MQKICILAHSRIFVNLTIISKTIVKTGKLSKIEIGLNLFFLYSARFRSAINTIVNPYFPVAL